MNVLILYAELCRKIFDGDALLAGGPQRGKDSSLKGPTATAGGGGKNIPFLRYPPWRRNPRVLTLAPPAQCAAPL